MPEGDTLRNIAAVLAPALEGGTATAVTVRGGRRPPRHRPPPAGTRIDTVTARGKHLLVTFDGGTVIHTHLQMTGTWHLYPAGARWRDSPGAARVRISTAAHDAVCFRAPTVDVYPARDPRTRPWDRLGPDLCDEPVDWVAVVAGARAVDGVTTIGELLLDQTVAAGIGNVYRCEVLWAHGVDPATPTAELDDATLTALYRTASEQLRANIGRPRRVTYRNGLAVYGRTRDCPRCHTTIRVGSLGDQARTVYWCPSCQPGNRLTPDPSPGRPRPR